MSLINFKQHLINQEKSQNTIEKYYRDVGGFMEYCGAEEITRDKVLSYKNHLQEKYLPRSVNSMLAAVNAYLDFIAHPEFKVKTVKIQRQIFCNENMELTKEEYFRLCHTAESLGRKRTSLILQTLCCTGIRVSELTYITVEAALGGEASVLCKGKSRTIFIVSGLSNKLLEYADRMGIEQGPIFITAKGTVMSRNNIWREMKDLCKAANVNPAKVYPHNLRHLFARTFYEQDKDIAKLADVLGHSSIETTRIYIISSGKEHKKLMEQLELLV